MGLLNENLIIKLASIGSFFAYFYSLFINYTKGGDQWIPIIFMVFSLIFGLTSIIFTRNKLQSFIYIICLLFCIFIFWKNATDLRNEKNTRDEDVNNYTKRYLILFSIYCIIGFITLTPIASWVANSYNQLYSKSFIFTYVIICFTIFLIYDSIRNFDLFKVKDKVYKSETIDNSNNKLIMKIILGVWIFYNLLIFSGFNYVGEGMGKEANHDISLSFITLLLLGATIAYFTYTVNNCGKWNKDSLNNDFIEIKSNLISITVTLLVLISINKIAPL
tara:strand:+ start:17 stop:844 length:828 start_codon:yes stop_codon:yes gene_type:complete